MDNRLRVQSFWIPFISLALILNFPDGVQARELSGKSTQSVFSDKIILYTQRYHPEPLQCIEMLDPVSLHLSRFAVLKDEVPNCGRVSPNGKYLAVSFNPIGRASTPAKVVLIDGENHRTTIADDGMIAAWSPDSKRLLLYRGEKYAWTSSIIDVESGSTKDVPLSKSDLVMDWSADGSKLSVMAGRPDKIFEQRPQNFYPKRQLYLFDLGNQAAEKPLTDSNEDCIKGMFSPDGSALAYSRRTYNTGKPVELCEVTHISPRKSSTLINFTELGVRPNGAPFWSKDGKKLVWQVIRKDDNDNTHCELWFLFTDGSPRRTIVESELKLDFFRVIDWR